MKRLLTACASALLASSLLYTPSHASDWQPPGPIKMMIGFKAGGGADTQARLIAEAMQARLGWKVIPEQVTGKGGLNLAKRLKGAAKDGTAIGIVVTETLGYNMAAAKRAGLKPEDFTPLATTAGFQMGVIAKTDKGWKNIHDVFQKAQSGEKIRFGAFSPRTADLAYLIGKANNVDFNIVMAKGGKGVMNGINADDLDIGWAAGPQAKGVKAGELVNLMSGLSTPLILSPDAPLIKDLGVPFNADGYFVYIAPAGIPEAAKKALSDAISDIVNDPETKAHGLIKKAFGGATVLRDDALDQYLKDGYQASAQLLKAASE